MAEYMDTDGTIPFAWKDKVHHVPQASIPDYKPWLAELHEKTKAELTKLVPVGIPFEKRFELLKKIDQDKPTHWTLAAQMDYHEAVERVLKIVLPKANFSEAETKEVLEKLPAHEQYKLACYTSGLWPPGQLSRMFGPSIHDLEQQAAQMLSVFSDAMKAAGLTPEVAESVLLKMPGVTPELLKGEPAAEKPKITTFAKNG
jgi:hypothetical protein